MPGEAGYHLKGKRKMWWLKDVLLIGYEAMNKVLGGYRLREAVEEKEQVAIVATATYHQPLQQSVLHVGKVFFER